MARQSLGRGMDSLIPKDLDKAIIEDDGSRIQKLLISDIKPNPGQPRTDFNNAAMAELVESVKLHGVLQPIIAIRDNGAYVIVAGERRWRAAKAAGLSHLPVIVRSLKELERVELSLIENIQRVDLSPLEQAISLYKLQQQFSLTLDEISKKLGKAPSTISNLIRLLALPEAARQALAGGKISEGHGRAILALKGHEELQAKLLSSILDNGWTVRQAEQFAKEAVAARPGRQFDELTDSQNQFKEILAKKLGAKVVIKRGVRGGRAVIKFGSDQDLDAMIKKLGA